MGQSKKRIPGPKEVIDFKNLLGYRLGRKEVDDLISGAVQYCALEFVEPEEISSDRFTKESPDADLIEQRHPELKLMRQYLNELAETLYDEATVSEHNAIQDAKLDGESIKPEALERIVWYGQAGQLADLYSALQSILPGTTLTEWYCHFCGSENENMAALWWLEKYPEMFAVPDPEIIQEVESLPEYQRYKEYEQAIKPESSDLGERGVSVFGDRVLGKSALLRCLRWDSEGTSLTRIFNALVGGPEKSKRPEKSLIKCKKTEWAQHFVRMDGSHFGELDGHTENEPRSSDIPRTCALIGPWITLINRGDGRSLINKPKTY